MSVPECFVGFCYTHGDSHSFPWTDFALIKNTGIVEPNNPGMHLLPIECDGVVQTGQLYGFDGNITAQGKLLLQVC